jgi:DNA (cytosine-5)-methyltransferase 1
MNDLSAISLFTCGGIGDLALRASGYEILVSNELHEDRHAVFAFNFPHATAITGDIWEKSEEIVETTRRILAGRELDLLYATPPCQGMSRNGRGKLLNAIRAGERPPRDERNRLIIPTIEIARALKPKLILLENVPEMEYTAILDGQGEVVSILQYIQRELGGDYCGRAEVVEFADYGVPQCRRRLITVFSRQHAVKQWLADFGTLMPSRTHSEKGEPGTDRWVSVRDVIADLPPLDAGSAERASSSIPYHRVPLLDELKYWWVSQTPPEKAPSTINVASAALKRIQRTPRSATGRALIEPRV